MAEASHPKGMYALARLVLLLARLGAFAKPFRVGVVLVSMGAFAVCLTQVAFVTPGGNEFQGAVSDPAMEFLLLRWLALPFAFLSVLISPLILSSGAATALLYFKRWRKAVLALALGTLGLV
jgi:hypothetical protein